MTLVFLVLWPISFSRQFAGMSPLYTVHADPTQSRPLQTHSLRLPHGSSPDRNIFRLASYALEWLVLLCTIYGLVAYCNSGNTTYAALSAVLAANAVLAGYVYLAFAEDAQEREEEKKAKTQ